MYTTFCCLFFLFILLRALHFLFSCFYISSDTLNFRSKTFHFLNLLFLGSSRIKSVLFYFIIYKIAGESPKTWLVCVCPTDN